MEKKKDVISVDLENSRIDIFSQEEIDALLDIIDPFDDKDIREKVESFLKKEYNIKLDIDTYGELIFDVLEKFFRKTRGEKISVWTNDDIINYFLDKNISKKEFIKLFQEELSSIIENNNKKILDLKKEIDEISSKNKEYSELFNLLKY